MTENINISQYINISFLSLVKRQAIHFILIYVDVFLTMSHGLDIYINNYTINYNYLISPQILVSNSFKKISDLLKTVINILIILYVFISYNFLNKIRCKENIFIKIIINFNELILYRPFSLFILILFFSSRYYYLIINVIFSFFFMYIVIKYFLENHLYFFSLNIIKYPFDYFSLLFDFYHFIIKILLAFSHLTYKKTNIANLCFNIAIIFHLIQVFHILYIIIYKSYYIMNNTFLNKSRISLILSSFLMNIFIFLVGKKKVFNYYYVITYVNIVIFSFLAIHYFYDPYSFMQFTPNNPDVNIFYYFFILNKNKNKYFLLEEKIDMHFIKCGRCPICRKYKVIKHNMLFEEDTNYDNKNKYDLFPVLYDGNNNIFNIMNNLIRCQKIEGKDSIIENSFLISLLYNCYSALHQKNYILASNCGLLYNMIIRDKKKIQKNENEMCLTQIKLINKFMVQANNILNIFNEVITENLESRKLKQLFLLGNELNKLKIKNVRPENSSHLSEFSDNFKELITICSLFYEELYNTTLSGSGIQIRENPVLIEELLFSSLKNKDKISLEINIRDFSSLIIRAGGKLSKYINQNFYNLFPTILKNKQILDFKKIILNSKTLIKNKKNNNDNNNHNNQPNNNVGNDKLSFIITKDEEKSTFYILLNIKFTIMFHEFVNNYILLNGKYSIDDKIIITKIEKNKEVLMGYGNKETENYFQNFENKYITRKKNWKFFNNKRLISAMKFNVNNTTINVYHFYETSKLLSKQLDTTKISMYSINRKNNSSESDERIKSNLFDDIASQSSLKSKESNSKFSLYNKSNKKILKEVIRNKKFSLLKKILLVFCLIIIIYSIGMIFVLNIQESKVIKYVNYSNTFINFFYKYNTLFLTTLATLCIGITPNINNCSSATNELSEAFKYIVDINFTEIFHNQTLFLIDQLNTMKSELFSEMGSADNVNYDIIYNNQIIYHFIKQNVSNNTNYISIRNESRNFYDIIILMSSHFHLISKNIEDKTNPVYLVDTNNFNNPLKNVRSTKELSQYQENYYLIILNFDTFYDNLQSTQSNVRNVYENSKSSFVYVVILNMIVRFCFLIILYVIINLYFIYYLLMIIRLFKEINITLNEKYGEQSHREILIDKIKNLKKIINQYEENLDANINDLSVVYNNYLEKYNQKLKEESKLLKNDIKKNDTFIEIKSSEIFKTYQYFKKFHEILPFIYFDIITIIIWIIIFIILIVLWVNYIHLDTSVFKINDLYNSLIIASYKVMDAYKLANLSNKTIETLTKEVKYDDNTNGKDFYTYLYSQLENVYLIDKHSSASKIFPQFSDFEIYTCKNFYEVINNDLFNYLKESHSNVFAMYILLCQSSAILSGGEMKSIYAFLFNYIKLSLTKIQKYNYGSLLENLRNTSNRQFSLILLTFYNFMLDFIHKNIQIKGLDNIFSRMSYTIRVTSTTFFVFIFIFIVSIFFYFVRFIDIGRKKLIKLEKVFKICYV